MQEEKTPPPLEIRGYRSNGILALIVWICLMCLMVYNMRQPDGPSTIMFLIVFSGLILTIINFFDKRPRVIIEEEGIWKRKYLLPFSPMILVHWNEMQYLYLLRKEDAEASTAFYLIIRNWTTETDIKIELTPLDSSLETIFSLIRQYAEKHGIQDLGVNV